ncbi:hypothetical protein QO002_000171 [Pararhizobium capsulatum DSM 1112]|uniref:Uncharacterized protein n=1 Tax=Pararhizobium capsulatum DSM 1112 TaxID=1121113 RepID=A0ABU0BIF2_9HYPH|nr:hypothetical protein [Pararhizobium capsulatum]MDQ0318033.1 hypothetical protein [Pararhizobium capsulatum DSM 1112]
MPDPIQRTPSEQVGKLILDEFLMPDRFEHPIRRRAADDLAHLHSNLAKEDKAALYHAMDKHIELGSMFAQSVITQSIKSENHEPIKSLEIRKFVIGQIPNIENSYYQAQIISEVTKEKLTPHQASFVVKNVLDYFEDQIRNLPQSERYSHDGDLDLRFHALEHTAEFHTDADRRRLAEMARADANLDNCLQNLNERTASAEGRQTASERHTQSVDDRHYDERPRGAERGR